MNVIQVNHTDRRGGAALIAYQLFLEYRRRGHLSRYLVRTKTAPDMCIEEIPEGETYSFYNRAMLRMANHFDPAEKGKNIGRYIRFAALPSHWVDRLMGYEDFHYSGFMTWLNRQIGQSTPFDIIHLHNLHPNYFDLRVLPWISRNYPVILTLHDTWLLSGHCGHFLHCMRWQTGCGICPDLSLYPSIRRDGTAHNWRRKQEIYARSKLYLSAPSRWVLDQVEQSMLYPALQKMRVIPNGIDLSIFKPSAEAGLRSQLGIPHAARIILFSNINESHPYKDYQTLRRAVEIIAARREDIQNIFLSLGGAYPTERIGNTELRYLPYESSPTRIASVYQAADLYLHAARADTFPTVVLEAMACGLPVVATAVGGIPEQVQEGKTGYLVPPGDAVKMADRVDQLFQDVRLRNEMGKAASDFAQKHFDINDMVDAYLDYYQEIIQDWKADIS